MAEATATLEGVAVVGEGGDFAPLSFDGEVESFPARGVAEGDELSSPSAEALGEHGAPAAPPGVESDELRQARETASRAAAERAERETRQRMVEEEREQQERRRFEETYHARRQNVGARISQELYELGLPREDAERIAGRLAGEFEAHHTDGMQLHAPQAFRHAGTVFMDLMNTAFRDDLGREAPKFFGSDNAPQTYKNVQEALKAYRGIVQHGMVAEAEATAREKAAVLRYRRELEQKGLIQGARDGQRVNSDPGSSGRGLSLDEAISLPITELMARRRTG